MTAQQVTGVLLLFLGVACVYVAIERYQSNADAVKAMNQRGGRLFEAMTGGEGLVPKIPLATKQALVGALLFGAGGTACLLTARANKRKRSDAQA